jgi:UDP-GlcNAc:undecaprenyl-phosphate GlcNAc-1-phosphate transferase
VSHLVTCALTFVAAAAAAFAVCGFVRRLAPAFGGVDQPRAERWHVDPRPLYGGIGIAVGTLAGTALSAGVFSRETVGIAGAAIALFAVGLVDDRRSLTALAKLVATLTVGALLTYWLAAGNGVRPPAWIVVAATVWFAGLSHAMNLLDNMDGLAGGVGLIAALWLSAILSGHLGASSVALLVGLGGALAGFLRWNVHPARLFMGDCGSLFIGGVLGGATLVPLLQPSTLTLWHGLLCGLVLLVPLFDTTFVLVLRRLAGRSATRGGTDHVSHRLVSMGFSQPVAVGCLWGLGMMGGAAAFALNGSMVASAIAPASLLVVGVVLFGVHLARVPAYNGRDFAALAGGPIAPIVKDLTFRWRAFEVLLDLVLITVAYYAAYRLRFEDQQLEVFLPSFTASLPIVLACKLAMFYASGLYSRDWSAFSLDDVSTAARAVSFGSVLSVVAVAYLFRFVRFSRGVFVIDAALLLIAVVATRASSRLFMNTAAARRPGARRVLLYGAGVRGQVFVRQVLADPRWRMRPVVFLDDAPVRQHRRILGVWVAGNLDQLEGTLTRFHVDEVVITTPAVGPEVEACVRERCKPFNVPVRRLRLEIE